MEAKPRLRFSEFPDAGSGRKWRIVLYSHDAMGLGHIRRNVLIALRSSASQDDIKPRTLAGHHRSILTSTMLSVPVPCSQKRTGSPTRAPP